MIKINEIKDITCLLYNPNDELVGEIKNEYSFNDVRIQIKKEQVDGYYIIFTNDEGKKYKMLINKKGNCESYPEVGRWPKGFYTIIDIQLNELIGIYQFLEIINES